MIFVRNCQRVSCIEDSSMENRINLKIISFPGIKTIIECVRSHRQAVPLIYGFEGKSNADGEDITKWMKGSIDQSSVLVVHSSLCGGFEWPTVISISV